MSGVALLDRLQRWLVREHWLTGAALTRILLGTWALYYYALHLPVRGVLWGPDGWWPFERFVAARPVLSVWAFSSSPAYAEALYLVGIAVAAAYTLGWHARLMGALHWLAVWSLQERNPFIGDGGDNLMRIVLLFLVLVDAGARLSVDARRPRRVSPLWVREVAAVAHNVGVVLVVAQLALLYASTGLYKAAGELWQNGTALYYILRVDEFSNPALAATVYRSPYLVVGGTYGTVLFEVMFPAALFNPWTRGVLIVTGVLFHVGIAVLMGLVTFAWSMLSLYPLLLTDAQYRRAGAWVEGRWSLTVFYDGWCADCRRSIAVLRAADLTGLVRFVSFREPGVAELFALDPRRLERRIHSVRPDGAVREGMDVMVQVAGRAVLLWPLAPLLAALRLAAGQRVYDLLAARRTVLVPPACGNVCAAAGRRRPSPEP
ncbi:MAG: DCC1-like thiol-disulfide oxidoreductase family protein [Armatimonadota bacterium]|nr:DCC1-like thiol-disulfide oxidoreductase family protein [Armatimonadota bacterium]MDR7421173.1 DCC1-like thiol-disulfide oxidoreductase family protein [Armatimonadota bacterium]MDR7496081.1 DCC1-like thiol-disulfide oxidoreductase family protein [Armatimonadota bacterium]